MKSAEQALICLAYCCYAHRWLIPTYKSRTRSNARQIELQQQQQQPRIQTKAKDRRKSEFASTNVELNKHHFENDTLTMSNFIHLFGELAIGAQHFH